MADQKSILMVAAENDALPGAKVGGIGDVVRDLPVALSRKGCTCHVVIPSYGYLHELEGAVPVHHYSIFFAGGVESLTLYRITRQKDIAAQEQGNNVHLWVIEHQGFYPFGAGVVYCDDGGERPFASDANKYALFSTAVAQAAVSGYFGDLDVLHLHDWHAAFIAILRAYDPRFIGLQKLRSVYSIHNLSLQGVRPFKGDPSSFKTWFPSLSYDSNAICDPVARHCVNPMRAAIVLSDKVHAVSPSYAQEIQRPSHPEDYFYGGEGLQGDLIKANQQGRLVGILNGCEYPVDAQYKPLSKTKLIDVLKSAVTLWAAKSAVMESAHWLAEKKLGDWAKRREKGLVITSVGRLTEQKIRLLKLEIEFGGRKCSVLEHLLDKLKDKGVFVLLGSGDAHYEGFLREVSAQNAHFIFLKGYSDAVSQALYNTGNLFLMPSSFEPCGISQMLAMRAGQPCLVHGVGGLNDTVHHGKTGFVFRGENGWEQGNNLLELFDDVLSMPAKQLTDVVSAAAQERFTWDTVAQEYLLQMYV